MALDHILSFQLYSSREFPPVADQLETLAALSFTNVEPYDDLYEDLDGFAEALARNNLKATSGHFSLSMLEAEPDRAVAIATRLGMRFIIAPWLDPEDRPVDAEGWKTLGARLEALRARFAESGFQLAWHNHDFEFSKLADGSYPIEHLLDGNAVGLELDIAWVARGGEDPTVWLKRFSDRIVAVHVKDIAPAGENLDQDGWTDVGKGVVDWAGLWPLVKTTSARLAVLEHDQPADWRSFAENSARTVATLETK
jgi:sugar phosphate isomerase/epimerase